MDEDKYYELIDIYKNPEHSGKLQDFDVSEEGYSTSCGDTFNVYLKMENGTIKEASFEGNGCIISTVSISKLCSEVVGKSSDKVNSMGLEDVKRIIGIDHISASRVGCALVGLETIKKALAKYKL
jgi:NifU-like protein involved in Fe-S cluster formation